MMQGGASVTQDLPPFTTAAYGVNKLCGLNIVGLRRAGFTPEQRLELKKIYHLIFRRKNHLAAAIEDVRKKFSSHEAKDHRGFRRQVKTRRLHGNDAFDHPDQG